MRRKLIKAVALLRDEGLIAMHDRTVELTDQGKRHARELVRAHRLWETYLVSEAGLTAEQVHDSAEHLEHAHELSDALYEALGEPEQDPHGSEIPRKPEE